MIGALRERATDLGYAAGWNLIKTVPGPLARGSFAAVADAAAVRNGKGARQLRANLRRVVGPGTSEADLDHLVGDALRSYARYWLETFRLPRMDRTRMLASIDANQTGIEYLDAGLAAGRGVILALPHQGNWDACGVWLVERNGSFTTVVEQLRPASLFERFVAYRESLGFEVVPLTGGARPPIAVLRERLEQNKVVCLVADRDLSEHGVEVSFFGERARMPGGPALLAATTGASLHVAHTWFTDDGWAQSISPPLTDEGTRLRDRVTALTQAVATGFEPGIRAHAADWHMLQRLWSADLPAAVRG